MEYDLKTLFPRASASFIKANPQLRAEVPEPDPGSALVGQVPGKETCIKVPVLSIRECRTRLLDKDNLHGSVKALIDCLCQVGLITDDSPSDIDLQVTQEKVAHRKEERTEIEIIYP